ncbi:MAG TPA: hypothetical protein ENK18_19005 [Deltaproteobacteria bacterium]|nr:hypothetical protein [Deltaproteobacteria bacterium]
MGHDDGQLQRRIAGGLIASLAPIAMLQAVAMAPLIGASVSVPRVPLPGLGLSRALVAAAGVVLAGSLIAGVTLLGAVGACTHRRWGWALGVGVAAMWVPTAGGPLALIALGLLSSVRPRPVDPPVGR